MLAALGWIILGAVLCLIAVYLIYCQTAQKMRW
jgi:hypothetical protein